jgi:outer membrane protein TolC
VDVLRAQVQLANDKQALLIAQNQHKQSLLALERAIGITPGEPLELAESLHFTALKSDEEESLLHLALVGRSDYLSLASQRQSLIEQQLANKARSYPKVSLNGNYGAIGRSIGGVQGTGLIQGQIDFTLYNRDRQGEAQEVASRIRAVDEQIADLRRGISEDVREALLNLESAAEQVAVATEGEQLARRELELSQDRFKEGTANNVEVVTAQDELARAEENTILAVTSHTDAKFALARSLGDTEMNMARFEQSK